LARARQRQLARLLIDAGADAVVGAHPHVVQNVEQYQGKPIIYSLGNFIFDGFRSLPTTTGWMLQLEVDRTGAKSWSIFEARIDTQGTPRPSITTPHLCWNRATPDTTQCVAEPR
jgi:poly-gamma-glutamate synthesis protein (capsule biosynthesis protein)